MVARKQYFFLTRLDADGLTALKRRDQIPFPGSGRNEYSLFDAFTFLISDHFADAPNGLGMTRTMAVSVVRDVARQLIERQAEIEKGEKPIMAGRVTFAGSGHEPFCGTPEALADLMSGERNVIDAAMQNVGTQYEVLRIRCDLEGVPLEGLWPDDESVPSFEERRAEIDASWGRALKALNA